jgi:hypothetical protein
MTCYDNYPMHIVILNLVELFAALSVGLLLTAQVGWGAVLLYALLGFLGVLLSLAYGCTRCCYYGKVCGMGVGKIAALAFSQRDEGEFGQAPSQTLACGPSWVSCWPFPWPQGSSHPPGALTCECSPRWQSTWDWSCSLFSRTPGSSAAAASRRETNVVLWAGWPG